LPKQRLPEGHFEHADAASMICVTKNTILRWEKLGVIDPPLRDRNNHRIFTTEHIEKIKRYKNGFIRLGQVTEQHEDTSS
jgi:DNA-binding transcriptional MerR regulator